MEILWPPLPAHHAATTRPYRWFNLSLIYSFRLFAQRAVWPPLPACWALTTLPYKLCNFFYVFQADVCPQGTYCPEGSVTTSACPPGTYNPAIQIGQLEDCVNCTAGRYCANYNLTNHGSKCDAGKFWQRLKRIAILLWKWSSGDRLGIWFQHCTVPKL